MSVLRVVSIGAAVQDVFLSGDVFTPHKEENGELVEEFELGAKLDVDHITFSTGGGASNAAVTFARHGYVSAFMGKIGHDPAGAAALADLKADNVDSSLVVYSDQYATGYSVLLLAPNGERTILTYRGASNYFEQADFDVNKLNADWLYISSMAGCLDALETILNHAQARHIKVAYNPGKADLKQADRLRDLLHKCEIVSANKEEWQLLVGGELLQDIARQAASIVPVAVVTDGPFGSVACGGDQLVTAGMYEDVAVVDRTGAGDAFCSGFTAVMMRGGSLQEALTFASANSTSVVGQIGAKAGILRSDADLHEMELHQEPR